MLVCCGFFVLLQSFISLNLKACKFSLYVSKNTRDLENEADQIPERACTSKLPTWNQMSCTGAQWCDFLIYTKKGMSIERITFNISYRVELQEKLCQ